jgi:hypothetical protein
MFRKYKNHYFVKFTDSNPFICIKEKIKKVKKRKELGV